MAVYDSIDETFEYLAGALDKLGLVYVHLVDHSSMGAPAVPPTVVERIRQAYKGNLILSGGYDKARAEENLQKEAGELIAFGRPFIGNPDLVQRLQPGAELVDADQSTFYTPGAKGYTDYPSLVGTAE